VKPVIVRIPKYKGSGRKKLVAYSLWADRNPTIGLFLKIYKFQNMEELMGEVKEEKAATPEEIAESKIKVLCEKLEVTPAIAKRLMEAKDKFERESGELKLMKGCLDKLVELRAVATKLNDEYQMVQTFLTKAFDCVEEDAELVDSINTSLEEVQDNLTELLKKREVPK
jgi:uncharacterized membrane-anchored protein YjiN (DUF445 family)